MNDTTPTGINTNTNISHLHTKFEEGTWQRIFIELTQKYSQQAPQNLLLILLTIIELPVQKVKDVITKLLVNSKTLRSEKVICDAIYSYNLKGWNPSIARENGSSYKKSIPNFNDYTNVINWKDDFFPWGGSSHLNDPSEDVPLISHRICGDKSRENNDYRYYRNPANSLFFSKGYWYNKIKNHRDNGLIPFVMEVMGGDRINAVEYIADNLGISFSSPNITQSQNLVGHEYIRHFESYHQPVEFHYDERIFERARESLNFTSTGKYSFSLLTLEFNRQEINVFVSLQVEKETNVPCVKFIAPPDEFLNDYHYRILHGTKRNETLTCVAKTHSERIEDFEEVDLEPTYIVWPLFEQGEMGLIISGTGVGKTMVALEIAIAVACGGTIGNRLVATKDRKVFYLLAEMSKVQVKVRGSQIFGYHPNSKNKRHNFRYTHLPSIEKVLDLTKESDQRWLVNEIQDAEVVILDHLRLLISPGALRSDVEWKKFKTFCRELTRKGITLLIPHQETKQGLASGSGNITQDVDFVFSLEKPKNCPAEETHIVFEFEKFRHPRGKEHATFMIKYTKENKEIRRTIHELDLEDNTRKVPLVTDEEIAKFSLSELHIEILHKARLTLAHIKAGMFTVKGTKKRSSSNVSIALSSLCDLGLLEMHGVTSGTYYTAVVKA